MRRRLLAITVATTTLVVVAFAIPLGALVRSVARDRAITEAERDTAALAPLLALTRDAELDTELLVSAIERTGTGAEGSVVSASSALAAVTSPVKVPSSLPKPSGGAAGSNTNSTRPALR